MSLYMLHRPGGAFYISPISWAVSLWQPTSLTVPPQPYVQTSVFVGQCFCMSRLAARISSVVAASLVASEEFVAFGHPLRGGCPYLRRTI